MSDYELIRLTREDKKFYCIMGWFFGSRLVAKELGMPVYDDENRIWVVVMEAKEAIACSSIELHGKKATLKSSWVKPEYRKKKIYEKMLAERLQIAKEKEINILTATATKDSEPILLKNGFKIVANKGKYHVMQKEMNK